MRRCHSAGASAARLMRASRRGRRSSASDDVDNDEPLAVPSSPTALSLSSEYVTSGSVRALEGDDVSDREAFSARGDVVSPASAGSSSTRLRRLLANWGHWYRASGSSVSSCSSFEDSEAIAVRGEEWAAWPEDAAVVIVEGGARRRPLRGFNFPRHG